MKIESNGLDFQAYVEMKIESFGLELLETKLVSNVV